MTGRKIHMINKQQFETILTRNVIVIINNDLVLINRVHLSRHSLLADLTRLFKLIGYSLFDARKTYIELFGEPALLEKQSEHKCVSCTV